MKWIERYQYYMRRTRLLGILGAGLVVVASVIEMWYAAHRLSLSEAPILHAEFIAANLDVFLFAPLMVVVFFLRIVVLRRRPDGPYRQHLASWMAAMATVLGLWWWLLPSFDPIQPCEAGKICFGIHHLRRTSLLEAFSLYYIWGSLFRSGLTALFAALKSRYK